MVYNADDLKKWDCQAQIDGQWVCARPMNNLCYTFWMRLKVAWKVFRGEYDALK